MGLYDDVTVLDEPTIVCAAGHPVREFQTKDLDDWMLQYLVRDKGLWCLETGAPTKWGPTTDARWPGTAQAPRVEHQGQAYRKLPAFDGLVGIHTTCRSCPVLDVPTSNGWVNHWSPWVEYQLRFTDGVLDRVRAVRLETVDEVRAKAHAAVQMSQKGREEPPP